MIDYEEATAIRRSTRLIRDSNMNFSVLNIMVVILVVAVILAGIGSIFKG